MNILLSYLILGGVISHALHQCFDIFSFIITHRNIHIDDTVPLNKLIMSQSEGVSCLRDLETLDDGGGLELVQDQWGVKLCWSLMVVGFQTLDSHVRSVFDSIQQLVERRSEGFCQTGDLLVDCVL